MQLHNTFTLRTCGKTQKAHNQLSEAFGAVFSACADWAQSLSLLCEDGTRVRAAAQLRFINADVCRGGELRAVYAAAIPTQAGQTYTRVALGTADADVSVASVQVEGGEEVYVTALILCTPTFSGDVYLVGGDNPLVRRLLGAGAPGEFAVASGTCDYPLQPAQRSAFGLDAETVPAVLGEDGTLVLQGGSLRTDCECVLLYGGVPVLRAFSPTTIVSGMMTVKIQNCGVTLSGLNVDTISSVRVTTSLVTNHTLLPSYSRAYAVRGDTVAVGAAGRVLGEPGEEYVGLVTHAEIEVYAVEKGVPRCVYRTPHNGEFVSLCRGGAVVLWSETVFTVHQPDDDGNYAVYSVPLERGKTCAVQREGARYNAGHVLYTAEYGDVFYRYCIDTTSGAAVVQDTPLTTYSAVYPRDNPLHFTVGRCGDALLFGHTTPLCYSIDVNYSSQFACAAFTNKYDVVDASSEGAYVWLAHTETETHVYDLVRGEMYTLELGYEVCGRLLYKAGRPLYFCDFGKGLVELEGDFTTEGLTGAAIADGYLFTIADGIMRGYYLAGGDYTIRFAPAQTDKNFRGTVRRKQVVSDPIGFSIRL